MNRGYVTFQNQNILESYQQLLNNFLDIKLEISDYVDIPSLYNIPDRFNFNPKYILVNIGGKANRNLTQGQWVYIINELSLLTNIIVIDNLGQPNITILKKNATFNSKVIFIEQNHSLLELFDLSRKSQLYIGIDGGATHLLQIPVNSLIIFTMGNHYVWRPYSHSPYQKYIYPGLCWEETITSKGLKKFIAYHEVPCRPCLEIGCNQQKCINDFDQICLVDKIKDTLIEEEPWRYQSELLNT